MGRNAGKYGPEKTPNSDTFLISVLLLGSLRELKLAKVNASYYGMKTATS